ncbi:MAG: response regulator [Phycisphaerales bacterium]|nr:response regulator [Phycisphaerales bacterium]
MPSKVLIADDEHHIRHMVAAKLRSSGFEVTEARDGAEALDLSREIRPDIVVSDFQMPQMSGLEFCTALTAEQPGVRIIMLTARGHVLSPEQMRGANIRRMMSKPFSASKLVECVRELLSSGESAGANLPEAA